MKLLAAALVLWAMVCVVYSCLYHNLWQDTQRGCDDHIRNMLTLYPEWYIIEEIDGCDRFVPVGRVGFMPPVMTAPANQWFGSLSWSDSKGWHVEAVPRCRNMRGME